uniref:Uncharacterized protein n=1 Tax=Cacopsylla melanoneura TaxID=428564 RepID=A0A8D8LMZ5_9HEMI
MRPSISSYSCASSPGAYSPRWTRCSVPSSFISYTNSRRPTSRPCYVMIDCSATSPTWSPYARKMRLTATAASWLPCSTLLCIGTRLRLSMRPSVRIILGL